MARLCGWCTAPSRATWERRVATGESVAIVAASTPFSIAAAHRHLRAHAQSGLTAELRVSQEVRLSDFVDRLLQLGDQAADVRRYAATTHQPRLVLTAIREEATILDQVLSRIGVDSDETLSTLRDAEAIARAVAGAVADGLIDGETTTALASRLRDLGASDQLTRALGALASKKEIQP